MKIQNKLFIGFSLVSVLAIILFAVFLFPNTKKTIEEDAIELETSKVNIFAKDIESSTQFYKSQVLIYGDLPPIQGIIRSEETGIDHLDKSSLDAWEMRLSQIFSRVIEVDSAIDQIRYIDETGKEIVRVNNVNNKPIITSPENLQIKSHRDYYIDTMQKKEGEVYISDLNLNEENGKVEVPHKPMIRFATPIFSEETGKRKGIVIINVRANNIIDFLRNIELGTNILIDQDGYFLLNPEKEKEFSKQLNTNYNYFKEQPELENNLKGLDSKNHHDLEEKEFRTWKKIYFDSLDKERYWVLFSVKPDNEVFREVNQITILLLVLLVLFSAGSILIGTYFSKRISSPINELSRTAKELETGNFRARANVETDDELGKLAQTFNKTIEALQNLDKEHKQIDKAKTEFLSITSHELRSPMTPMQAQLQMLLENYYGKLNKKQRESLDIVTRNTKRLDNIIQDFLEVSRIEAARLKFKFVKTNLADDVKRLVKEMKGFMPEKNIKLTTKIGKLPIIEVDPDRTMQILRNLINNAMKFSPKNSEITISAFLKGNKIHFSVKDQGIGIPERDHLKIFEPFYQAEQTMFRKFGGTGLGLAICKGIAESQNGKIWVRSKKNEGATFHFTVPLKPVKEIKPIRVLISNERYLTRDIENTYKDFLGPLGGTEFKNLEENFDSKKIISNINKLEKQKILNSKNAEKFRNKILQIYHKEPNSQKSLLKKNINNKKRINHGK